MDLNEFIEKFRMIKDSGFIPSMRRGPTGVGHTLEHHLGLTENNIALPDLGNIELKAHRDRTSNLITLFTFNRKAWKMPPLEAIKKYGSSDKDGRLGLYYTLSSKPNSAGLFVDIQTDSLTIRHIHGDVIAVWSLENLTKRFLQKIPALIFVNTFVEERDGIEYFHYYRARLLQGTEQETLYHQFLAENIVVDLRLHDDVTRARNHGTGFRVRQSNLPELFNEIRDLI